MGSSGWASSIPESEPAYSDPVLSFIYIVSEFSNSYIHFHSCHGSLELSLQKLVVLSNNFERYLKMDLAGL